MKTLLPPGAAKDLCPLFLSNTHFAPARLPATVALPKDVEVVLNGSLLGTPRASGLGTQPGEAPAPLTFPLGVEALPGITSEARVTANTAALDERTAAQPDLQVLPRDSGRGGLGALASSVNGFYTPREVALAMWAAAGRVKDGARPLDPSCGVGSLLILAPQGAPWASNWNARALTSPATCCPRRPS